MDKVDAKMRSRIMSAIRSKNTLPELAIKKIIDSEGIIYSMHVKGVPGTPDFMAGKRIVFYHSRFWHCRNFIKIMKMPRYWKLKLFRNFLRDVKVNFKLRAMGYSIREIWGEDYKDRSKVIGAFK